MRRFLPTTRRLLATVAVGVVAGFAMTMAISSPSSATGDDFESPEVYTNQGCLDNDELDKARYKHIFHVDLAAGKAVAWIKLVNEQLCPGVEQEFSLVSYITKSGGFELPQHLYDSQSKRIRHDKDWARFEIKVPACYTQVDFVFGPPIANLTDNNLYGNRKVGSDGAPGNQSHAKNGFPKRAWFNGGEACTGKPKASAKPSCDGSMVVNVRNIKGAFATTYTIHRGSAAAISATVTPAEPMKQVTVPPGNLSPVVVKHGDTVVGTFPWTRPADCAPPTVTEEHDCTELRITVSNPQGNAPIKVKIDTPADATAAAQSQVSTAAGTPVTINGGASHTFKIPASENLAVAVIIDKYESKIVRYLKPADCGGGGGGLPVTGAKTSLLIGGGLGLVALGGGLFWFFRRRQVTFTVS